MATKFRKKPVVIEAVQWTGLNLVEVVKFTDNHTDISSGKWSEYVDIVNKEGLYIHTLEGRMFANIGDWIIIGVKGECYPCKPDIFELTYEVVE